MSVRIAIIGMGQTGTSIGLALAEHKPQVVRVGHDKELRHARAAEKAGALDEVNLNLPATVEKADLVVLAVPLDQMRETLQVIGPELRKDAVVVDMAPVKKLVMEWAQLYLPEGRHYIGLVPMHSPLYLEESDQGRLNGHADLFKRSVIGLVTPHGANPYAVRLATDFIHLLGADHMFADAEELDGVVAATHVLPGLLAAALVNATTSQPGWHEGRKFADRAYAAVSSPAATSGPAATLAGLAFNEPGNTLRVLDNLIGSLSELREKIAKNDVQGVEAYFEKARLGREQWWQQRGAADWEAEMQQGMVMPTAGEVFGRIFGLGKPKEPKGPKPRQ